MVWCAARSCRSPEESEAKTRAAMAVLGIDPGPNGLLCRSGPEREVLLKCVQSAYRKCAKDAKRARGGLKRYNDAKGAIEELYDKVPCTERWAAVAEVVREKGGIPAKLFLYVNGHYRDVKPLTVPMGGDPCTPFIEAANHSVDEALGPAIEPGDWVNCKLAEPLDLAGCSAPPGSCGQAMHLWATEGFQTVVTGPNAAQVDFFIKIEAGVTTPERVAFVEGLPDQNQAVEDAVRTAVCNVAGGDPMDAGFSEALEETVRVCMDEWRYQNGNREWKYAAQSAGDRKRKRLDEAEGKRIARHRLEIDELKKRLAAAQAAMETAQKSAWVGS